MRKLQQQDARLYSSFRLPAVLNQVLLCETEADLRQIDAAKAPLILGEGSNSIFLTDIQQPVLRYVAKSVTETPEADGILLHVEAGKNWHELVSYTVNRGWWGLENLALIPGSVGAAPVQNIGAYGVELTDSCVYVDFFHWDSQQVQRLSNSECLFGYRDSIFKRALEGRGVIVAVGLRLHADGAPKLNYKGLDHLSVNCSVSDVYQAVLQVRRSKLPDPQVLANCGSFFKNPLLTVEQFSELKQLHPQLPAYPQAGGQIKTAAAWLIEQAGFKGQRSGDIGCYELQPLVLVNYGHGTAADLEQWMDLIIATVQQRFGICLEPEVRMLHER
jgi:UDP-N-acetylmuramate dehydrogenase